MAPSRAPVFITGESGTGKEVCAEAIHQRSGPAGRPFVAINCSAIPRDLMESEIFGHVRGAFTGAAENRAGAAELADGGTLFLDEVAEMDLALQAKLLRFVQTGTIRRVGGTELTRVNVRIICATNRDPFAEVEAGRFRADLFYRLHVLPIHLEPLRQRPEDVMPLALAFLARFAVEEGRTFRGFTAEAERRIMTCSVAGQCPPARERHPPDRRPSRRRRRHRRDAAGRTRRDPRASPPPRRTARRRLNPLFRRRPADHRPSCRSAGRSR